VSPNAKPVQPHACALLLALSLITPAPAHALAADVNTPVRNPLSNIDIKNFGRVNPHYYRGAEPNDDDYAHLAAMGVKTVIDLRSHDRDPHEKVLVESVGMKYVQIPMTTRETPSVSKVQEFLRIVTDPANQPVYVHCVGGRHRTGVMTAVYRMAHDGWTADQAFKEMKEYDFGPAFLHPEFKRFVYEYEPARSAVGADGGGR
jgi:tyrosine-protein phosphatase SIW14